jgi:hypothetical protein
MPFSLEPDLAIDPLTDAPTFEALWRLEIFKFLLTLGAMVLCFSLDSDSE